MMRQSLKLGVELLDNFMMLVLPVARTIGRAPVASVRLTFGMSGVLVQEPLPASPKCHWYSRSWKGRVVASAVVPAASKNTDKGATPEMRLATSEGWMASVGVTGVHAGTEPE